MGRILSIFNSKKIPTAFLTALMVLFAVECVVRFKIYDLVSVSTAIMMYKNDYVHAEDLSGFNALLMGDSRALGVHSKRVSQEVSQKAGKSFELFNYAYPQTGVQSYYLLLEDYLNAQKKPEWIVFMVSPLVFGDSYTFQDIRKPYPVEFYHYVMLHFVSDLWKTLNAKSFYQALLVKMEYLSWTVAFRERIQMFVQNHFKPERPDQKDWLVRSFNASNGGSLISRDIVPTDKQIKDSNFYQVSWSVDSNSLFWMKKFFKLAQDRDIKVMIINAPVNDVIFSKREKSGFHNQYAALMENFEQEFYNVYLTKQSFLSYPKEMFGDVHHLNVEGFKRFTAELSQMIAHILNDK